MTRASAHAPVPAPPAGAPRLQEPQTILDLANYCLTRISKLAGSQVTRVCEGEFGITRREWRFVALLAAFGELSPSLLAVHATLDRATTSKALTSLSLKGLVRRTRAVGGGRHFSIRLTDAGRQLYEEVFPRSAAINLALIQTLSGSDCRTLARLLAVLQARAEEMAQPGPDPAGAERPQGSKRARRAGKTRPLQPASAAGAPGSARDRT